MILPKKWVQGAGRDAEGGLLFCRLIYMTVWYCTRPKRRRPVEAVAHSEVEGDLDRLLRVARGQTG